MNTSNTKRYAPLGMSASSDRLCDESPRRGSDRATMAAWGVRALAVLADKLLEVQCHFNMVRHMAGEGLLNQVIATDRSEDAVGNLFGFARAPLIEAGWLAGYVRDLLGDRDGDPLHETTIDRQLWYLRSSVAMSEAYANNLDESSELVEEAGRFRISNDVAVEIATAAGRIVEAIELVRDEAEHAKEYLQALLDGAAPAPAVAPSAPTGPSAKSAHKSSKTTTREVSHA